MSQPQNLNLVEIGMVNRIYAREMRYQALSQLSMLKGRCSTWHGAALRRKRFQQSLIALTYIFTLTCSKGIAAPPSPPVPPAPYVCSKRPIQVTTVQGIDANGNPIEGPAMALDTAICACSDGVVRMCQ